MTKEIILDYRKLYMANLRISLRAKNICTKCCKNKTDGGSYCELCRQKNRNRIAARKENYFCIACGKALEEYEKGVYVTCFFLQV